MNTFHVPNGEDILKFIADFLGSLFSFQKMLTCDKKERPKAPHVCSPPTSKHHWVTEETILSRSIKLNLELCWTNWICQWSTVLLSRYLMIAWTQAGESRRRAVATCDRPGQARSQECRRLHLSDRGATWLRCRSAGALYVASWLRSSSLRCS